MNSTINNKTNTNHLDSVPQLQFDLSQGQRAALWTHINQRLETYYSNTKSFAVCRDVPRSEVRKYVKRCEQMESMDAESVIDYVVDGFTRFSTHNAHPGYLGLFNPRPVYVSTMADVLSATFNSQLATWDHSPFAVEIEQWLIESLGNKFGFDQSGGSFTAGGAEGNLSGLLCALASCCPEFVSDGIRNLSERPTIYCSTESHHSLKKASRIIGLGEKSVRLVPVDENGRLNAASLEQMISDDVRSGLFRPFVVVATAGTTGGGAIDELREISEICDRFRIWFHVDAAYGGAAALSSTYRHLLNGIEKADSVTFDLHKWPSLPIGTSVFLTSQKQCLDRIFGMATEYMPGMKGPYSNSIQWSRRFIGLRFLLPLLLHGWSQFELLVDRQMVLGKNLRELLRKSKWQISNSTELPVVCFNAPESQDDPTFVLECVKEINRSGKFWCSSYKLNDRENIRICLSNYLTNIRDLESFVELADTYRSNNLQTNL